LLTEIKVKSKCARNSCILYFDSNHSSGRFEGQWFTKFRGNPS